MSSRTTFNSFLAKAIKVHGDTYDYSLVDYKTTKAKVKIVCKEHGAFWQKPENHLAGQGCPVCGLLRRTDKRRTPKDVFIAKAKEIHGGKYDYSIVVYKNARSVVEIICPEHGSFFQTPDNHLKGCGCASCRNENHKHIKYGVGVNDLPKMEGTVVYSIWSGMLRRCYSDIELRKKPSYIGVTVCDEWHSLSNFKKWFDNNYVEGYQLDKDILANGTSKVYSPDTCCFIPAQLNAMLTKRDRDRGDLPLGVTKHGNKFRAHVGILGLKHQFVIGSSFDTPMEAFQAYKKHKEYEIKRRAKECFDNGEINKRVYDALMKYEVKDDMCILKQAV